MATLTTLASFSGADGAHPIYGSLLADANGNLFGATLSGGATGDGTVSELVNTGSGYTFQTLASLDFTNGSSVFAGLTMDAQGNLFGVAQGGGASGQGTVFELANTGAGYSLQTVATFSGTNGAYPTSSLIADGNGNLFGATQNGGANGQGSVFELVKGALGYSLQTLYSFNFTDGAAPAGPLIMNTQGDLFGTTLQGGPGGKGTVFELDHTGQLTTLATFDGSNGSYLYSGLTADAQGDLFGTTYSGGANGYGTVFELVHTGSGYTFQTLASLDYFTTGGLPTGGLVIDANGNLYGTAQAGGVGGFGTVFELVNTGSGYSLQTIYGFSGGLDGASPKGTLILDANGNLLGTTASGGPSNSGTVFEISLVDAPNEQAALHLTVNSGSATPIGAMGAGQVGFTVAGMLAGETGTVTFTDQANHTVAVQVAAGQTHYTADFSALTDGAVSASLQVTTNAGGVSFTPVAGNTVALDTVAPAQPTAPGDDAVAGGYVNAAHDTAGQTIGGTAEAGSLVTIFDNGTQVATAIADGTGVWSWQVGVLADGSAHSYTVTATDAAGNVSAASAALAFTVDTAAPVPAACSVTDAGKGLNTVCGVSEAGSTVTLFDGGQQVGVATAGADGHWAVTLKLNGGQAHQFTETAVDLAGNVGVSAGVALWANPANKALVGGAGDDVLIAGKGSVLTGGGGHDHFVFDTGFSRATITDFTSGTDQIWLNHTLFDSAILVMAHAQRSGGDMAITDSAGDQLLLKGVSALHAEDFVFF